MKLFSDNVTLTKVKDQIQPIMVGKYKVIRETFKGDHTTEVQGNSNHQNVCGKFFYHKKKLS